MPDPIVILGFDFGGTKIAAAVGTLGGARLASTVVDSGPADGAQAVFARGIEAGRGLLDRLGPGVTVAAVGAVTFGIPFDDHVELAPSIPGWDRLAFGTLLRRAFPGIPIRMSTDVKAAAAAEARWGALAGRDPALYVNLGTGLGAAIVSGGAVLTGAHGAAGEIGYNLRDVSDLDQAAGDRRTLEDVTSGRALAGAVPGLDGRLLTAADLFGTAPTLPAADAAVERFLREVSLHVANLAVTVDPAVIAVGGGMVRSWARLQPALRHALDVAVPFPPELVPAAFPYDAPLIGALAIGADAAVAAPSGPVEPSTTFAFHPPYREPSEVQR